MGFGDLTPWLARVGFNPVGFSLASSDVRAAIAASDSDAVIVGVELSNGAEHAFAVDRVAGKIYDVAEDPPARDLGAYLDELAAAGAHATHARSLHGPPLPKQQPRPTAPRPSQLAWLGLQITACAPRAPLIVERREPLSEPAEPFAQELLPLLGAVPPLALAVKLARAALAVALAPCGAALAVISAADAVPPDPFRRDAVSVSLDIRDAEPVAFWLHHLIRSGRITRAHPAIEMIAVLIMSLLDRAISAWQRVAPAWSALCSVVFCLGTGRAYRLLCGKGHHGNGSKRELSVKCESVVPRGSAANAANEVVVEVAHSTSVARVFQQGSRVSVEEKGAESLPARILSYEAPSASHALGRLALAVESDRHVSAASDAVARGGAVVRKERELNAEDMNLPAARGQRPGTYAAECRVTDVDLKLDAPTVMSQGESQPVLSFAVLDVVVAHGRLAKDAVVHVCLVIDEERRDPVELVVAEPWRAPADGVEAADLVLRLDEELLAQSAAISSARATRTVPSYELRGIDPPMPAREVQRLYAASPNDLSIA
ncbi:hypothetical protein AURANDRAFT_68740 [Aureococcus anophagefferens]|uniref:Uncharacterized protein n=1 Tax=Aureococcus anophagefferens TaxID=44056 RepID=F0YQL8_AURAN|nr:hypothetical protein AURANDRAFT_68740 [Aureococcus anophagefferens]EGB02591.1 hypothetical protein AURANDRAFT_68740 [Aureococcus anophagefferens]|eukprot:XP_009042713.1 hypothetical protein AURANDRAFT_68740 [Aureococcus anophagefferens]